MSKGHDKFMAKSAKGAAGGIVKAIRVAEQPLRSRALPSVAAVVRPVAAGGFAHPSQINRPLAPYSAAIVNASGANAQIAVNCSNSLHLVGADAERLLIVGELDDPRFLAAVQNRSWMVYDGPTTIDGYEKSIQLRYQQSMEEVFPPRNILVSRKTPQGALNINRRRHATNRTNWVAPTPIITRGNVFRPLDDQGVASLLGTFDVSFRFNKNAPSYVSLLRETDGRFDVCLTSNRNSGSHAHQIMRNKVIEYAEDGLQSLGSVVNIY
jgi:hypothetical protein